MAAPSRILKQPGISRAQPLASLLVLMSFFPSESFPTTAAGSLSSGSAVIDSAGRLVYVVNPESGILSVIDAGSDQLIRERSVGLDSRCAALSPDEGTIYVTSEKTGLLNIIDVPAMKHRVAVHVDAGPYGVVASPVTGLVYVASSVFSVIDVVRVPPDNDSLFVDFPDLVSGRGPRPKPVAPSIVARIPVSSKPKGLAISADGSRLYVTHFLTGEVSVIDTTQSKVIQIVSTGADSNMAQKIAINPADGRAYLPHIRSNVTNPFLLFDTTVFPTVSVIDVSSNQDVPGERLDLSIGSTSVNLPFDVAFSPDGARLYSVNLGSGDVAVMDLTSRRRLAVIDVGEGPRGIALTPDGRKAYVVNSLSDDVSVLDLDRQQELSRIQIAPSPLSPQIHRGKVLFFSSHSTDISRDRWMSCASCHFEGDIDGRTWQFTSGPRNTTTMAGVSETLPLHWSADRDEVQDFEFTIRTLQAGSGLIKGRDPNPELGPPNAGLSQDLDALAAYVLSIPAMPNPFPADSSASASIERGRAVFNRADTGCVNCHPAPRYTDSSLARPFIVHDVGTGDNPGENAGSAFDTPSLRGLWDTPPYLHDGSASGLRDILVTHNSQDRHGRTSQLTEPELNDLIAFLLSL